MVMVFPAILEWYTKKNKQLHSCFFLIADDTEYGYHSASSSSAEHHAQLGPIQQQMVNQQQNYIQGQAQSHVSQIDFPRIFAYFVI